MAVSRTLYGWFADTAGRRPELTAVEAGEVALTYGQLSQAADALAGRILRAHGRTPRRVALLAARGPAACVGYLATLRLAATIVPLNPVYPVERNRRMVELAGADVLIVNADGPAAVDLGDLTTVPVSLTGAPDDDPLPPYAGAPEDVAYLLFTSGSTGRPKGVPVSHRAASAYVGHNLARYGVGPGDRMSHTFDLTFDPSVFDLFVTWAGGATLVVPAAGDLLRPAEHVRQARLTHWFSVPSVISVAAELGNLAAGHTPSLRQSTFIGEALTLDHAAAWRAATTSGSIDNVYGPTELTVACSEYRLPAAWPSTSNGTVPIGQMYPFLEWVVVDEDGRPAPVGELCVRGVQRFGGYLDRGDDAGRFLRAVGERYEPYTGPLRPEDYYRTGDRVRDEDGELVHLGRLDNQVKVRGYRVELGEIEHALRGHPDVSQAIVVAIDRPDGVELVGCYTGQEVSTKDIVRWLRQRLPVHMVPRQLHRLDAIPLNSNGKADRGRIRELVLVSR
jgi:amino acid adenylation domain-containing protein